eukprot:1557249-Rhodomonas_salina.4
MPRMDDAGGLFALPTLYDYYEQNPLTEFGTSITRIDEEVGGDVPPARVTDFASSAQPGDNEWFLFGGTDGAGNLVYGDFYVYNGTLELFQNLTLTGSSLSRPGPRRYHSIAASLQMVYLFGGENSGEALTVRLEPWALNVSDGGVQMAFCYVLTSVLAIAAQESIAELKGFDRATRTWVDFTAGVGGSAPSGRVFPSIAADADKLYVFGQSRLLLTSSAQSHALRV